MPQLRLRGINKDKFINQSKAMIDEMEKLLGCPRSYFTIECMDSVFIMDNNEVSGYPFVEVYWFDRGQDIKDEAAKIITKYVRLSGYENIDVIFFNLSKNDYYENGEHF
jgi:hypothetical protein